ncbi:MAG: eukaryotic-like serine/threonine-protein kinase [Candidatus Eremiobacteraeota bacterium]|nr:eukaryotic-like serine/threonine-protein kinase [Candidatus Eremiobacteraeota bacterium]
MASEELLGGRYRLEHVAGHGGMATVFVAHDTKLDRKVAIKLLARRRDASGTLNKRFEREARAEAKIVHPNVVSVHDYGVNDEGRPYIVMDYVEGEPLSELIAEAPLSSERVAAIGFGIARALAAVHALGIFHRDVKPANVIIDGQGVPHLMDFGLAREIDDEDPGITAPGILVGTANYVAPEQARYGTASSAADLYSLGAVLYHALTGEPPFAGDNALDVALRRFEEDPRELRELLPAADSELTDVIHALLARDPVDRPWDAKMISERLGDITARLRATRTAGEAQEPLR